MEFPAELKTFLGDGLDEQAGTFTAKFVKPVKINGEEADSLTLCEPTLDHLEQSVKKPGVEGDRTMIALAAGVLPANVLTLPVSEYQKAMAFLNFFMRGAPATGANASAS